MDAQTIIARRVARELHTGDLVNLGIGLPTQVAHYLPRGVNVFFQSENGLVGMQPLPEMGFAWADLTDAGLDLDSGADRALARALAEESVVLLANDGVLPLRPQTRLAVVGPQADNLAAMLGCYTFPSHVGSQYPGTATGVEIPTVLAALKEERADLTQYEPGCDVDGTDTSRIDEAVGSLDGLLDLSAAQEAEGLGDAPWPPHYKKQGDEPPRVAPSRRRATHPLITVAKAAHKDDALAGLERWKARHPDAAAHLQVDDVLVDSMRGRSTTWTRIRVNLRHVPEPERPAEEPPDPDYDPWRASGPRAPKTRSSS